MSAGPNKLARLNLVCPIFVGWAQQEIRMSRLEIEADQLARARHVGEGTGFIGTRDFGPVVRFLREEVQSEFRADPDPAVGPLVQGGRVRDGLHAMMVRKQITIQQWQVVSDFRDDIDIAAGARPEQPDRLVGIRSPFSGAAWPDDVQCAAMRRVRQAWGSIPPALTTLTVWTIVCGATLETYSKAARVNHGLARSMLHYALAVLEETY